MRRLHFALLCWIPLCRARQPGFSIHEDLLAHPQFEVFFSDSYILERDAQLILERLYDGDPTAYDSGLLPSDTDLTAAAQKSASAVRSRPSPAPSSGSGEYGSDDGDGSEQVSETYEVVNVPPLRYLCSIPVLAPPAAPNQTATELAKAEEAKEMNRVSVRGVELVNTLQGECMFYVSGWWSYSFCYGNEIVQFHALTMKAGKPVKDQQSQEYVLGRMIDGPPSKKEHLQKKTHNSDLEVQQPVAGGEDKKDMYGTELQVKGDQKYMVQHLGAGTICDLTNRERTIEVQYHCNPGGTSDRISWIKEVTTCSYLMEVRTPRLCQEAAFLPPKPTRAHPISCQRIVGSDEEAAQQHKAGIEAHEAVPIQQQQPAKAEQAQDQQVLKYDAQEDEEGSVIIGGIAVGARQALRRGREGEAPLKLESFRGHDSESGHEEGRVVQILAQAPRAEEGGAVEMLPDDELARLKVNAQVLAALVEKVSNIARGKAWRVEALEVPGHDKLDIRAIIEPDEEEEAGGDRQSEAGEGEDDKPSKDKEDGGSKETFKKDEL